MTTMATAAAAPAGKGTATLVLLLLLQVSHAASPDNRTFPDGFFFGCATASYQVEGAWNESGKGESIWDRMVHSDPGSVKDLTNGDVACDSYHKYKDDVALVQGLGMDVYRFSLSWPRLLPDGSRARLNPAGVEYYDNLITELLSKGIKPLVTLYHWDLPQALQDLGGWPNPVLADYYEDYADLAFRLFGDKVKMWITFNEPFETCVTGYGLGEYAPRLHLDGVGDYLCGHTILRAHARAYRLYHHKYAATQKGKVGITWNSEWFEPRNSSSEEDRLAADRAQQFKIGWFAHPVFSEGGDYPPVMRERVMSNSLAEGLSRSRLPTFTPAEVAALKGSADFFGLNHYSTYLASPAPPAWGGSGRRGRSGLSDQDLVAISRAKDVGAQFFQDPSWPSSALHWCKDVPWGFRKLLVWIRDQYGNPPLIVTENGFADHGELDDQRRIKYYTGYLDSLLKAIYDDGCNVLGYFTWSLMDNFEWSDGYTPRFGLHHVNFSDPTRPRTPKASAALFKRITRSRRLPSEPAESEPEPAPKPEDRRPCRGRRDYSCHGDALTTNEIILA